MKGENLRVATSRFKATPDRLPATDEVHLWAVNLAVGEIAAIDPRTASMSTILGPESESGVALLAASTTDAERARAARYRHDVDRSRFLAARGALRLLLGGYLDRDPCALDFSYGTWGKPALERNELSFNLSHSAALAMIAVARGRQVGVDVERQRPIPELDELASRICSCREREALNRIDAAAREGAFLALWTRKEALAKMTGEGVRDMAHDVSDDNLHHCRLEQLDSLPGYAACVAAQGTDWRLVRPA